MGAARRICPAGRDGLRSGLRELREETGVSGIHLEHFGVYDNPGRDPRGWIISNAHYAIVPEQRLRDRKAAEDASAVELFSVRDVMDLNLAFDHRDIIRDAIRVIRRKLLETTIARAFLPEEFTYSELQSVLRIATDDPAIALDSAFARKLKSLPFIEEVKGKKTTRTSKRPTQLYRFTDAGLNPSIYHR